MPGLTRFHPVGEGLLESEIPFYRSLISKAIVRVEATIQSRRGPDQYTYQTGFAIDSSGLVVTCAHGILLGSTFRISYFGSEFELATAFIDKDRDIAFLSPKSPKFNSNFLELHPSPNIPVGTWVYTIASTLSMYYTFYHGIVSNEPCPVQRLRREQDDEVKIALEGFPSQLRLIPIRGMWLYSGCSGAPIMDNKGQVVGIYTLEGRNHDFAIHPSDIPHLTSGLERIQEDYGKVSENLFRRSTCSRQSTYTLNATMVTDRLSCTQGTLGHGDHVGPSEVSSAAVSTVDFARVNKRIEEAFDRLRCVLDHVGGSAPSSPEKSTQRRKRGVIENQIPRDAVIFDHSRVMKKIDEAFRRFKCLD